MRTGISIVALALAVASGCARPPRETGAAQPAAGVAAQSRQADAAKLSEQLASASARAGGDVGVAVLHVETGAESAFQADKPLPLFSVFKLPLAVAVLREVEAGRLGLDQKVRTTADEVVPGWQGNTDLWRRTPVERTIEELLELSIARSDNTSTDKLLALVGGPAEVTRLMQSLGLADITIQSTVREYFTQGKNNTGTARDFARLLALLREGKALGPRQTDLLVGMMERATTGERRLRGALPAGTRVADKTGTGAAGTNDVGLITLPDGRGHLAMAVLISNSKLSAEDQEKLIAELARAAYDAHAAQTSQ